jgi:hypothetical protein
MMTTNIYMKMNDLIHVMSMSPMHDHQEQMRGLLQAVQQDGAPGGAHEGLVPLGARAQVRRLREALPLLGVAQGASHRYVRTAETKLSARRNQKTYVSISSDASSIPVLHRLQGRCPRWSARGSSASAAAASASTFSTAAPPSDTTVRPASTLVLLRYDAWSRLIT